MLIESEYLFGADRDAVWDALQDPEILGRALPGTERLERVGGHLYAGVMVVGVGPVTAARFDISVELTNLVPPEAFTMIVGGQGRAGFIDGRADVRLEERGTRCLMRYRADLQVGGLVAAVGKPLLDTVGRNMSHKGLEAVDRMIG
ncbi:MAG TPA: carbon monoxide dehydrogenase subunit G [Gemmatimonadota bacterium]|nr:carbon monoxide dehydrogenase subunit G [Gemmatimonadota bacterium]